MSKSSKVWSFVEKLSEKSDISEVIINHAQSIFVERNGQFIMIDSKLTNEDIKLFAKEVADLNQQEFDHQNPIVDGLLPDGSRVNIIDGKYTTSGPAITIRRYILKVSSFDENKNIYGMSQKLKDFLKVLVRSKKNIVVTGGTGVGKTTFLNLLLTELGPNERVVTIEDTAELRIDRPNIVHLIAKLKHSQEEQVSFQDLVKNTLRMRPDRIIIGEARGAEFVDLLQAMNTGHDGSMTTVHANNAREAIQRMETLYLLGQRHEIPLKAIRYQMSKAIDFIIHLGKNNKGERTLLEIIEVTGMEGDNILTQDIVKTMEGKLDFTGLVPSDMESLIPFGLNSDFFMNF